MRTARPLSQGQRERLLRSPSARSGRGGRSPGPPGWPRRAGRGPPEPDGVHPGMELRENILSYIVIGGLCADDGIKDGDGWVDASCCARIDDGFHPAAVNEDLGSDGRIDLADTTVQSGGRNAGDPSLVIVSMACRRTERLSRRGRNGASSSSPAHRIPILGSTSHPSSLQSSCGYGGIVTRNVWERNQRLHRIMLYGII